MNICMIAYTFYETDNRVRRYAEALVEKGHVVHAIAARKEGQKKEETISGVKVFRIQKRIVNEKRKSDYLIRLLLFLWNSFWVVSVNHIRRPYSLIHVHSIPDFEVFSTLFVKLTGAKVILDIHDLVPELFTSKFSKNSNDRMFKILVWVEKLSISFSDHVIIANDIWRERLVGRSVRSDKCTTIMNYPDPAIFTPRENKRTDKKFVISYPGTLSKHQGLIVAIDAVEILKDELPDIEFHIYGVGTDEKYFQTYVIEKGLTEKIFFHGGVSIEEVAQVIKDADIGVEPKMSDGFSDEAFSTKILEFMMMEVPIIVADTSVHKYYIDPSLVLYFASGKKEDLAKKIRLLYNDASLRENLVEKSSKFISSYNWDTKKEAYLSLVDAIVNK